MSWSAVKRIKSMFNNTDNWFDKPPAVDNASKAPLRSFAADFARNGAARQQMSAIDPKKEELAAFREKVFAIYDKQAFGNFIAETLKLGAEANPNTRRWNFTKAVLEYLAKEGCPVSTVVEQRVAFRLCIRLIENGHFGKDIRAEEFEYVDDDKISQLGIRIIK